MVGGGELTLAQKVFHWGHENNIWQGVIALTFFTFYYKWLTPIKVRFNDAFIASASFVMLFYLGKTFYWVYLKHFQVEMINNFGDFYTIVEAVIWIYFLACSFFFSATVAFDMVSLRRPQSSLTQIEDIEDPPEEDSQIAS